MSALQNRDYHRLDPCLQEITSSRIALRRDEIKKYNEYLKEILEQTLIPAMGRADPLFKCLYKRLVYSGSYYEKLKISEPNEFDLNMELEIPSNDIDIITTKYNGFVLVKVKQFDQSKLKRTFVNYGVGETRLKEWLDDFGHLKRRVVLTWMQGVVDKALRSVAIPGKIISRSMSGPAVTLNIKSLVQAESIVFSIDLVPVFIFGQSHWPQPPVRRPVALGSVSWCVVPKAPGYVPQDTHWRMSFYDQEKKIMNDYNSMKHIIKIMKLLRDCNKWDCLSSYYIKTVFLWEMQSKEKQYWRQSIGFLFIQMLKRFTYHLKDAKAIPFYWDQRHSLIIGLNRSTIDDIGNRICRMVSSIEKNLPNNPEHIKIFFPGCVMPVPRGITPPGSQTRVAEPPQQPQQMAQAPGGLGVWGAIGVGTAVGVLAVGLSALMNVNRQQNNR